MSDPRTQLYPAEPVTLAPHATWTTEITLLRPSVVLGQHGTALHVHPFSAQLALLVTRVRVGAADVLLGPVPAWVLCLNWSRLQRHVAGAGVGVDLVLQAEAERVAAQVVLEVLELE